MIRSFRHEPSLAVSQDVFLRARENRRSDVNRVDECYRFDYPFTPAEGGRDTANRRKSNGRRRFWKTLSERRRVGIRTAQATSLMAKPIPWACRSRLSAR